MRLLRYTLLHLSVVLFLLLGGWGTFFYFAVIDEVMDETDDALDNYREIIVGKILADSTLLRAEDRVVHSYTIRPLTKEEAEDYRESFYDGTVYIETEDEYEPVRIMKSCFMATDLQYYELELRLSTLERDDLVAAILKHLLALYAVLLCCLLLSMRLILGAVFRPLDKLMAWLRRVTPGQPAPPLDSQTRILEFQTLNRAAIEMHERGERAYHEQKEFIENASHELQTPLAIVRGKLELLAESDRMGEGELQTIDDMLRSLNRAVQLNKSLLLLSRLQNGQHAEATDVDLNSHARRILNLLAEVYEAKRLDYDILEEGACTVHMDESLAHTMLANLVKNAIVHSPEGGRVELRIATHSVEITNDGTVALDPQRLFRRFQKGNAAQKESTGLGLAIAHSITTSYNISITYSYDGRHHFLLAMPRR